VRASGGRGTSCQVPLQRRASNSSCMALSQAPSRGAARMDVGMGGSSVTVATEA
jgi:hypothetical protein